MNAIKSAGLVSQPCCLICNRPLRPFDPEDPDPEGFERSLICEEHPRIPEEDGFLGVGIFAPPEYMSRVAAISAEVAGEWIIRLWFTAGYFSLLLELSGSGLLLMYPRMTGARVLYVPPNARASGAPVGLLDLRRDTLVFAHGPCDVADQKHGLAEFVDALEMAVPIKSVDFERYPSCDIDPDFPTIGFANGQTVRVGGIGSSGASELLREAYDLSLTWSTGRGAEALHLT